MYRIYSYRETSFGVIYSIRTKEIATKEEGIKILKNKVAHQQTARYILVADSMIPAMIEKFNARDAYIKAHSRIPRNLSTLNEKTTQGKKFTGDAIEFLKKA